MRRRAAISIGVNRPGTMLPLKAAAAGAQEFDNWARDQGCDSALITDSDNRVTLNSIFTCVRKFVDKRIYDQLIVYFSGHGILLSPGAEIWLLSDAPQNGNEAINLRRSYDD